MKCLERSRTLWWANAAVGPVVLLDAHATRGRVLAELSRASWLHLACHASQSFYAPMDGCLALADGNLTLSDVAAARAEAGEFAFLSACETSQVTPGVTDEILTVAMAIHHAGFPSVAATGWAVNDASARRVAQSVYRDLTSQASRPDAARAALAVHSAARTLRGLHPGYPAVWAAYQHIGV